MNKIFPLIQACAVFLMAAPVFAQGYPSRADTVSAMLDQMEQHLFSTAAASGASLQAASVKIDPVVVNSVQPPVQGGYSGARQQFNGSAEARSDASRRIGGRREREMDTTMRGFQIELTLQYLFAHGQQQFVYRVAETGAMGSRLKYQNEGEIPVVKGEVKLGRFALGGRMGGAELDKKTNTDEDWGLPIDIDNDGIDEPTDYNIATTACSAKVRFWDANLYYTLIERAAANESSRQLFLVDKFSLEIFGGYQWYRGRYTMIDPEYSFLVRAGDNWYEAVGLPANIGLDSPYKITYQGPRAGLRVTGIMGRLSTNVSFAVAYLKTRAHGYWNLRDYSFWHYGDGGCGIDLGIESTYAITPSWSAGLGYDFIGLYQKKLKATGIQPGSEYYDQDIIRNADNQTYGVSLILKYIW